MKKLKKVKREIWIAMAIVACCFMQITTVKAQNVEKTFSNRFVEVCQYFFENPGKCQAIDKNGNDVSNQFYEKYLQEFLDEDFSKLKEIFIQELSAFTWWEDTDGMIVTRAIIPRTASKNYFTSGRIEKNNQSGAVDYEIGYRVSGTYYVDSTTNKITGKGGVGVSITNTYVSDNRWKCSVGYNSFSESISSDKYSITVSGQVSFQFDYYQGAGLLRSVTRGPYSVSFTQAS